VTAKFRTIPSSGVRNLWLFAGGPDPITRYLPVLSVVIYAVTILAAPILRLAAMSVPVLAYVYCVFRIVTARLSVSETSVRYGTLLGWREVDIQTVRLAELSDVSIGLKYSRLVLAGVPLLEQPLVLMTPANWRAVLGTEGPGGSWPDDLRLIQLYREVFSKSKDDDRDS
jgi:hypothetical protein